MLVLGMGTPVTALGSTVITNSVSSHAQSGGNVVRGGDGGDGGNGAQGQNGADGSDGESVVVEGSSQSSVDIVTTVNGKKVQDIHEAAGTSSSNVYEYNEGDVRIRTSTSLGASASHSLQGGTTSAKKELKHSTLQVQATVQQNATDTPTSTDMVEEEDITREETNREHEAATMTARATVHTGWLPLVTTAVHRIISSVMAYVYSIF